MTAPVDTPLVAVMVVTELGAEYHFPDVLRSQIEPLLVSDTLHGFTQLTVINQSGACLVIPKRIIKTIALDGEIKWRTPSPA